VKKYLLLEMDFKMIQKINVLNDGFVRLVDSMGDDSSIVQAARISYGEGTKHISDDRKLIRYLMRNHHTSPFEMCEIKLHVRVPMDAWRQWIRHRTANVNEYSTRYSEAIDSFYSTRSDEWRRQSTTNKQNSSGKISNDFGIFLSGQEEELHRLSKIIYKDRLRHGVAREQARKDLPLSTYTEAYWKIDLHNLLHFLKLRLSAHAQQEIRQYAEAILNIAEKLFPITIEAFKDYELNSITFSKMEQELITLLILNKKEEAHKRMEDMGFTKLKDGKTLKNSEFIEFEHKLKKMDIDYLLVYTDGL
jgi:thymidylate synthase (FAD)